MGRSPTAAIYSVNDLTELVDVAGHLLAQLVSEDAALEDDIVIACFRYSTTGDSVGRHRPPGV